MKNKYKIKWKQAVDRYRHWNLKFIQSSAGTKDRSDACISFVEDFNKIVAEENAPLNAHKDKSEWTKGEKMYWQAWDQLERERKC